MFLLPLWRSALLILSVALFAASCGGDNWVRDQSSALGDLLSDSALTGPERAFVGEVYLRDVAIADDTGRRESVTLPDQLPVAAIIADGETFCRLNQGTTHADAFEEYRTWSERDRAFISAAHTHLCPEVPDPTIDPATLPPTPVPTSTSVPTSTPVPSPTPVPAIAAGSGERIASGLINTTTVDYTLFDIGSRLTVTGWAEASEAALTLGGPTQFPIAGQKLFVIDYIVEAFPQAYNEGETTSLSISGGGRSLYSRPVTTSGDETVLVSVPEDETPVLELRTDTIADGEIVQQLNPITGQTGTASLPALWSIDPNRRTQTVGTTHVLPLEKLDPDGRDFFSYEYGEIETLATINQLTLTSQIAVETEDDTRQVLATASTGLLLLTLDATSDADRNSISDNLYAGPLTRPEQATLLLGDGTEIGAQYALPDAPPSRNNMTLFNTMPYWEVTPGQITGATIVITPGEVITRTGGSSEDPVDYRDASIEIPIDLG